ncbi:hypothetical protein O181_041090 [Austropuccinia psidii MF-1]|uniref:Uncharacterized protein n=1 Tax=Austropuccinia psidii MF-1 TaxID=1389203 RepID=A0A9Q3DE98_9BASI|nr:hypothetical protein [Austropuccinia psidii MF-1]
MTPTRSGSKYPIQSNASGPGNSGHKSKRQEFSPEERQKWKITELPPVHKDIPVSVQEIVYGNKEAGVRTSSKSLDRNNELISSSEEAHGARKDRGPSEGLKTHFLQRTSPTDKSMVEKPNHFVRGPEEEVRQRKRQLPCGSSSSLYKQESDLKRAKKQQASLKDQPEGQAKGKGKGEIQVEHSLPTELHNSKERKDSHGQCVKHGKNSDGIK